MLEPETNNCLCLFFFFFKKAEVNNDFMSTYLNKYEEDIFWCAVYFSLNSSALSFCLFALVNLKHILTLLEVNLPPKISSLLQGTRGY